MKTNSHQLNWIVDAGLFTGFWLASLLDLTGLAVHEWLGLAVAILAGYHLLSHWTWVKSVTQRWFGHTSAQARRFYIIDAVFDLLQQRLLVPRSLPPLCRSQF